MATKKKAPAKKGPAKKAPARKAPARKAGRPAFKAGKAGKAGGRAGGKNPERKLPRKYGPRRKTPKSIGREAAPPLRAPSAPDEVRPVAMLVAQAGLAKKAEDVALYDVRGLSSYADYLVIMTAESDRQAGAIADNVDAAMKAAGHAKVAVEGYQTGTWIIVDYGDVVAHVFGRSAREFYDLDGLWADAPRTTVKD